MTPPADTATGADQQQVTVSELEYARFDRALERLQSADPHSRVALDDQTGLAVGLDGAFRVPVPATVRSLPGTDRAAAASVLFLDRYGAVFGIPGWHCLEPVSASPLGRTMWFGFNARIAPGRTLAVHVCADEDTVKHVRIERD